MQLLQGESFFDASVCDCLCLLGLDDHVMISDHQQILIREHIYVPTTTSLNV